MFIGAGYLITTMFMNSESKKETLHSLCLAVFFIGFGALISLPNISNSAQYNHLIEQTIAEEGIEINGFFNYRVAFIGMNYSTNKGHCSLQFPKEYPGELKLHCR